MVTSQVPFVHGDAHDVGTHLVDHLRRHGAKAEALRLPVCWMPPERLIEEMLIACTLRLWNVDRVIALRFPSYLISHPDKVLWVLHQYRDAYEMWDQGRTPLCANPRGKQIRDAVVRADSLAFAQAQRIYASTRSIANRLRHYNAVRARVLCPPLHDPELFTGGENEGYIIAPGTVDSTRRQTLLVQALRHAPGAHLVIAGPPGTPADAELLERLIEEEGMSDRVRLDFRILTRAQLADLINRSLAVAYLPHDDDGTSSVPLEAFQAGKPLITTSDSAAVLEVVECGRTGLVAQPNPESLGEALRLASSALARTVSMGLAARQQQEARGTTWARVVERLLA